MQESTAGLTHWSGKLHIVAEFIDGMKRNQLSSVARAIQSLAFAGLTDEKRGTAQTDRDATVIDDAG